MLNDPNNFEIEYGKDDFKCIQQAHKAFDEADHDSSRWLKFADGKDLKIWYQKPAGGKGIFSFYFERVAKAPLTNCCVIVNEFQTIKEWVPMVYESRFLHRTTGLQRFVELGVSLPWPIKNRIWYCSTSGEAAPEDDSFVVVMRTLDDKNMYHLTNPIVRNPKGVALRATCQAIKF